MPLQSLVICIDNSESARNGDFGPSRLLQQQEAANEIIRMQMRDNPENDVALLTTAGTRPELLVPLCCEQVALQRKLYTTQVLGISDPITSLRLAQMVLKHRKNRRHSQRVLLFLGSSSNEVDSGKRVAQLGQILRKANISVDMVAFGTPEEIAQSSDLLQPLVKSLSSNAKMITVTADRNLTRVTLVQLYSAGTVARPTRETISPKVNHFNDDPELMLAIQLSLQDMKQNVKRAADITTTAARSTALEKVRHSSQIKSNISSEPSGKASVGKNRPNTSSSPNTVSPVKSKLSKTNARASLSSASIGSSSRENANAILRQIITKYDYKKTEKYPTKQKDILQRRELSKLPSKERTAKSNPKIVLPRWLTGSPKSGKVARNSSGTRPLKQSSKTQSNTQKIQELITSKVKSLSAADNGKVISPTASSSSILTRTPSTTSRPSISKVRSLNSPSTTIKKIKLRLVPKNTKSTAKGSPSQNRLSSKSKTKQTEGKSAKDNDQNKGQ